MMGLYHPLRTGIHRKQLAIPHLGRVVVASIGRPDGQPPVLLVLLPGVAGLVPHAVAVSHPGAHDVGDPGVVFAGAATLQQQLSATGKCCHELTKFRLGKNRKKKTALFSIQKFFMN